MGPGPGQPRAGPTPVPAPSAPSAPSAPAVPTDTGVREAATPAPVVEVPAPAPAATDGVPLPQPRSVPFRPKGLENGDYAPELALTDLLGGDPYRLSDHLGPAATTPARAAVIGFVASWCGPCRASLPTLAELKAEHGDDLEIVLLATDDDREGRLKEADHVRKAGLDAVVLEPTAEVMRAYKGSRKNVPHFFIVNAIGEVLVQDRGFGKKVKPLLPKQVRYALNHPEYVERKKRTKKAPPAKPAG